jgi:hypothetical protein
MNNYISGEAVAVSFAIVATTTVGILLGKKENNVEEEVVEDQDADVDQTITSATPPVKEVVTDEPSLCDESVKTAELTVAPQEECVPENAEKVTTKPKGIRRWKPKLLRKKIQLETNQDDMLYTFKHR